MDQCQWITPVDPTTRARNRGWFLPEGWEVALIIRPDEESTPYDADCYSPDQIEAWKSDQWEYVLLTVVVRDYFGGERGYDSLGAVEHGDLGEGVGFVNAADSGYIDEMIDSACQDAKIAKVQPAVGK